MYERMNEHELKLEQQQQQQNIANIKLYEYTTGFAHTAHTYTIYVQ